MVGVDVVIGLGRSVLEGMAAARATYVYGAAGGDGWVTPERYASFEADGFAGTSSGRALGLERLAADLATWEPTMGESNRDLVAAHHNAREHAISLIDLGRTLTRSSSSDVLLSDELAHLVRLQWHSEARAVASQSEAKQLHLRLGEQDREIARLTTRVAEADAEIAFLKGTRRYRLAARIAAPLDRLRAATGVRTWVLTDHNSGEGGIRTPERG